MTRRGTLLTMLLGALLSACGGTATLPGSPPGPALGTPVPSGLAGSWFSGTISTIQFYDPVTGSWADPNGEGFYFIFNPDGSYEEDAVINSTQYTCTINLLGRAVGTFTATADTLTLHQQERRTQVSNTCSGVGENVVGAETTVYGWSHQTDEYGNEGLALTLPDGSLYGLFYPWNK